MTTGAMIFIGCVATVFVTFGSAAYWLAVMAEIKRSNEPNVGPKASTNCPGIATEVNPIGDAGDFVAPFHDGSDKP